VATVGKPTPTLFNRRQCIPITVSVHEMNVCVLLTSASIESAQKGWWWTEALMGIVLSDNYVTDEILTHIDVTFLY
jgi:hypothetical protein